MSEQSMHHKGVRAIAATFCTLFSFVVALEVLKMINMPLLHYMLVHRVLSIKKDA